MIACRARADPGCRRYGRRRQFCLGASDSGDGVRCGLLRSDGRWVSPMRSRRGAQLTSNRTGASAHGTQRARAAWHDSRARTSPVLERSADQKRRSIRVPLVFANDWRVRISRRPAPAALGVVNGRGTTVVPNLTRSGTAVDQERPDAPADRAASRDATTVPVGRVESVIATIVRDGMDGAHDAHYPDGPAGVGRT